MDLLLKSIDVPGKEFGYQTGKTGAILFSFRDNDSMLHGKINGTFLRATLKAAIPRAKEQKNIEEKVNSTFFWNCV